MGRGKGRREERGEERGERRKGWRSRKGGGREGEWRAREGWGRKGGGQRGRDSKGEGGGLVILLYPVGLTVSLPPTEVIPDVLDGGIEDDPPIKGRGVEQRFVREEFGPMEDIAGGKVGGKCGHDLAGGK